MVGSINPYNGYNNSLYGGNYSNYNHSSQSFGLNQFGNVSSLQGNVSSLQGNDSNPSTGVKASPENESDYTKKAGRKSSPAECETCANRKYRDGSDEMVSFKSAAHISPENAASRVRAHEQEHVSNAYTKASKKDGKVINASVSLQTSVCPECGRVYVSGGETTTQIMYRDEKNPYQQNAKSYDEAKYSGANLDLAI